MTQNPNGSILRLKSDKSSPNRSLGGSSMDHSSLRLKNRSAGDHYQSIEDLSHQRAKHEEQFQT